MPESVDVVVVGMGPGGEALAGRLAEAGLSVVAVESRLVGGECPYYGCVPSKMMIRAANALAEARRVPALAGDGSVAPDFGPVARRIRAEATDDWNDQVAADRFTGTGGRLVRGTAMLTGPRTVRAGEQEFTARRAVVLNSGTEPAVPPIPGLAGTPFWTNREAVAAEEAPRSLVVLGAGAIGLELAQAFARFGTRVAVVEAADRVLPPEEPEAGDTLAGVLTGEGLALHTGARAERVDHDGTGFTVALPDRELRAERLLVATGRRTDLAGLGLARIGVDTDRPFVEPDERMRVADGVYAIGDMTGKGGFTHVSMYQAAIAARDILGEPGPPAEYHAVPRVTFTDPEVGAVGLTEAQARDRGLTVRTAAVTVPTSARGWIHGPGNEGLIKLVEDAERGVLVGATAVGPHGGEVLSALAVAVHAEVPTERLRAMIYAYPTFHRAIEDALGRLH
ncbi:Pyruvate/2-oxoglutarate dehydrogenase complex, dihydrolipoamide dehydrogenase (E3) component [Amycolatopsis arida]|uniref:Pyruvate/2-oxoglutarate dehydrogenase complex, dihydrolipoamide dehydrogenase (E3) component n=1 Tax=Amycolatopsis arida TaxID=587909 RepID=A0A1I6AJB8_9PSEU|nr:NAD(P)/FAD-dependent oxidoreductase [Amycolatopsis arida]TDX87319.1 pyruvate/2-oxoglutarate dehydrogenase complex dihydrolipoamide dehydrogenase (E3) component [Amycolatopsis arida]SFQ68788.1 Pyruvate/2-oxoglutarate dehydrogenase complex, dihydrolipoamide dehydrogenase (E3) component [Amycolatopsis arida]